MDLGKGFTPTTPTRNTLLREGVLSANIRVVEGSKFGRAPPSRRGSDQRQQQVGTRSSVGTRAYAPPEPICALPHLVLPRAEWISLGDGWFQATPRREVGGSSTRCGLHSVIDGSLGFPFLVVYEPRTAEAIASCINSSEYDLELSAKVILSYESSNASVETATPNSALRRISLLDSSSSLSYSAPSSSSPPQSTLNFQVIFAFQSANDHMILTADVPTQSWVLSRVKSGQETLLVQVGHEIKTNQFYHILIQVRGNSVSVDINTLPIITAARAGSDEDSCGGLLGLLSRGGSKFAIKGWKLRGVSKPRIAGMSGGAVGGGAVVRTPMFPVAPVVTAVKSLELEDMEEDVNQETHFRHHIPASRPGGGASIAVPVPEHVPEHVKHAGSSGGNTSSNKKIVLSLAEIMAQRLSVSTSPSTSTTALGAPDVSAQSVATNQNAINCGRKSEKGSETTPVLTSTTHGSAVSVQSIFASLGGPPPLNLPIGGGGPGSVSRGMSRAGSIAPSAAAAAAAAFATHSIPADASSTLASWSTGGDLTLASAAATLYQSHDRGIVDTVIRDVVQRDLGVSFDDIAALSGAKRLLSEAVILPLMIPEFFTGIREPWKGVLLFGPPGTGKTLLAKAVCSLNQSSFFSCPSSSLVSKYRGESEKIVRCLFEAARLLAPSVVFLDEVDALVGVRGEGEHEASRRLKTEIFSQMDGIASSHKKGGTTGGVMVLATSNCPWDLDEAMRRRLEKRIFIPLPDSPARLELFNICLRDIPLSDDVDIYALSSTISEGYSGADIHLVCREAAMMPMRRLLSILQPVEMQAMRQNGQLLIPKVIMDDFSQAFQNTRPSVAQETSLRYETWEREYGSK